MQSWNSFNCRDIREKLLLIYESLLSAYGPQHWWPGSSPFEVIVGAILTQRVAWANVEKAIASLKEAGLLDPRRLNGAPLPEIASLIRSSVYYNTKADKLRAFTRFLADRYNGDLKRLLHLDLPSLRAELLSVHGIGEETADAIILYAAGKPSFVVDAYTKRILSRLGLIEEKQSYRVVRDLFMENLPTEVPLYNEYHALLVRHGKERCRSRVPLCRGCPLEESCSFAGRK
jgi:endonuclease-3 related protein